MVYSIAGRVKAGDSPWSVSVPQADGPGERTALPTQALRL